MDHSNDDLWARPGAERRRPPDEPTIQLRRVAKRRPERTRTHHAVAPDVRRSASDGSRRSHGRAAGDGSRPYDVERDDRADAPPRWAPQQDEGRTSWSGTAFGDFDDLRDVTRSQPAITEFDDLFDDFATGAITGGIARAPRHSAAFDDEYFDDGAYRDSSYVAGDDHFGPRADVTTVLRSVHPGAAGRAHRDDEDVDDDHTAEGIWLEPARRRDVPRQGVLASVDPRLLSVGAIALASVLAVPLIGSLTDGDGAAQMRSVTESAMTTPVVTPPPTAPVVLTEQPAAAPAGGDGAADADAAESGSAPSRSDDASAAGQPADASAGSSSSAGDSATAPAASSRFPDSAGLPAPSQRAAGHCGNPYEVQQGDFWVRLANATDMSVDDFAAYNNATIDTTLHPGDIVCLPLGTSITVPTTAAPASAPAQESSSGSSQSTSSSAPSTTQAAQPSPPDDSADDGDRDSSSTPPPSTQAPSTTAAPSRPSSSASRSDVEQMIRDVWPDELEEKALQIAWRESRYRSNVTSGSGCCHGVFQLHQQHLRWTGQYGVTSVEQLFDARTNIELAYALYERSGGWGPWAQTAH